MVLNDVKNRFKNITKRLKKKSKEPSMYQKMRLYYAEHYESTEIDSELVVYETRDGKSIVDSPYAMFLELASNDKYQSYKHVWVINKDVEGIESVIPKELQEKVTFIERGTIEHVDVMLRAKYLITNSTFESFFVKREGQIYINTWHGTPLKHMGFDIPGSVSHSQNVLRNFMMADYILSPNHHTSNIFINSYKLKGIYPGKVLESGYPRIDLTYHATNHDVVSKIQSYGTQINSTLPILLFTPTWKGSSVNNAEDEIEQIVNETLILINQFKDHYNVLIKVHPFIFDKVNEVESIAPYLISNLIDANELLAITDVLVTDYSSIFFDFLVTNKPIIFYAWDKDLYQANRGMYLEEDDLPGPTAENINDLITLIENVDVNAALYKQKYELLADKMVPYDDGHATTRYIDYIFDGVVSEKMTIHDVDSDKEKLLIYPGGMRNNGITSSLLNLVNNIDYNKYDVTVVTNSTKNAEINNNLKSLNPNARVMFRFGSNILTEEERHIDQYFMKNGVSIEERASYPSAGYHREMNRIMGNLSFDVSIDFSGYSYFWGRHILAASAHKYVAFMHNDLMADSMREINGQTPMKADLHGLFSIYYQFDKLLSVSPMTRDVNKGKLTEFITDEQMSYVYNSINIKQILHSKCEDVEDTDKIKISVKKALKLVSETIETTCFKNIDDIKNGIQFPLHLIQGQKVIEHATASFEDIVYSKVTVDGVYIGWIKEELLMARPLEVIEVMDYHMFGTVSKEFHYPIWNKIRTNGEEDQIVAYARQFRKRYLEVTKIAKTEKGRYFLVSYEGKEIGWMSSRPLMRLHKVDPMNLLSKYFRKKMKEMDAVNPVSYSYKVDIGLELFAKLNGEKHVEIWSQPSVVIGSVEFPVREDYYQTGFKINQKIYFDKGNFYRLSLEDGSFVGYVEESMVELVSEEEFEDINRNESDEYGLTILPKMDLAMQKVPTFNPDFINFVNMGRLSPEKNQGQLIQAFKLFNETVPNSRLYILGKGPLQNELVALIHELGMEGKVILLGHISSPFEFMKLNDFFVLPSFYEGQPMVLLESLTIGLNILASNIPANINVVGQEETFGLLTEGTDVEDIYKGLLRAYEFKGSFKPFDYHEYNEKAINNFYEEIS